jgi:hypothetical protein
MSLEKSIYEAWDNALQNGYEEWLLEASTIDIAVDMMDCDGDIELYSNGMVDVVVGYLDPLQLNYRKQVYGNFPEDYMKLGVYRKKKNG